MTVPGKSQHYDPELPSLYQQNNWIKLLNILAAITIEPLLIVSLFTIVLYSIISQQFIYQTISEKYGLKNNTHLSTCEVHNISNSTNALESQVSAETSTWVLYLNIAGFVPALISTMFVGSWGDMVGRKPSLILGFCGLLSMIVVYIVVIYLKLDVALLLIARFLAGACGDFNCILASCYAYIADQSLPKERTFRFAINEACTGIGGLLGSVVGGIWINSQGFLPPLWLLVGLLLASIFYILFILKESNKTSHLQIKNSDKLRILFVCRYFETLKKFFGSDWNRTFKVLAVGMCFLLQLTIHDGVGDVAIVYELSPPLCWSSVFVGLGSAIRDSAYLFGIVVIKCFSSFLSDLAFIFISALSSTAELVAFAFASMTWTMFLGYSFSILRTVSSTVLRSMISRLVSKDHQGSGFAIIACAELFSVLVASFLFNCVYSATVSHHRGLVFIMGAGLQILFFFLSWFVYSKIKVDLKTVEEGHRRISDVLSSDALCDED